MLSQKTSYYVENQFLYESMGIGCLTFAGILSDAFIEILSLFTLQTSKIAHTIAGPVCAINGICGCKQCFLFFVFKSLMSLKYCSLFLINI